LYFFAYIKSSGVFYLYGFLLNLKLYWLT